MKIPNDVAALLLDFDGPVCNTFAGYPAARIAADLRRIAQREGAVAPERINRSRDPLEILRWAGKCDAGLMNSIEDALCAAELKAVESAAPTPFVRDVIGAANATGRKVAIVSNNSSGAIDAYLRAKCMRGNVTEIVGRPYLRPTLMKPDPYSVRRAVIDLGVDPERCVFIGDSVSDMIAGQEAGVCCVGFANRPSKVEQLSRAGAMHVARSMHVVLLAMRADKDWDKHEG